MISHKNKLPFIWLEGLHMETLSQTVKDILTVMDTLNADEGAMVGVLSMLGEAEDECEKEEYAKKLLKYIRAKGKYVTIQDILSKALQICTGCEKYIPPNMYVEYIGESSEELTSHSYYQVIVSYNNDREYLIENDNEQQIVYDASQFMKVDVREIRYTGHESDDGDLEVTEGFSVGAVYTVKQFKRGKYLCDNGLECWFWESIPTKYVPSIPEAPRPFRTADGALKLIRQSLEFGQHRQLENSLDPACEYISQDANLEYHDAESIMDHLRKVADYQLEHDVFIDCALATVADSAAGNRFGPGQRCLPFFINGELAAIVFVTEDSGTITGIYVLSEPYEITLDEP